MSTTNGAKNGRSRLREQLIDLADVQPPSGEIPSLWGPYLIRAATHWITGPSGIGKSTVAYNLCVALAEGGGLWGYPCETARVLYIDLETGERGRQEKVDKLFGERPRPRGMVRFLSVPLRLPDQSSELIDIIVDLGIELVIIDTARRFFKIRDENSNAEVYERIVPTVDGLKAMGVATIIFGHPAKNGGPGARGAGAQEDFGDVNMTLTMHKGATSDPDGVVALQITKHRLLGYGMPPLYLKRIGGDRFEPVMFDAQTGTGTPERQGAGELCRSHVIEFLEGRNRVPATFKTILDEMVRREHKEGTAKREIGALKRDGEIVDRGQGYVLVDPFAEGGDY